MGSEKVLENFSWGSRKVLEKFWIFFSVKQWEPCIINLVGLNFKIRHGATVDNVVTYAYAKFGDDRL